MNAKIAATAIVTTNSARQAVAEHVRGLSVVLDAVLGECVCIITVILVAIRGQGGGQSPFAPDSKRTVPGAVAGVFVKLGGRLEGALRNMNPKRANTL